MCKHMNSFEFKVLLSANSVEKALSVSNFENLPVKLLLFNAKRARSADLSSVGRFIIYLDFVKFYSNK